MAHKTLINGTSYNIGGGETLIGGTSYKINKGKTLINGTGQNITFGKSVKSLGIGSSVYMNVGGVRTEFIIVHIGNPDTSKYDSTCDGIWIYSKNCYTVAAYDSTVSLYDYSKKYSTSTIHPWLNGDYYNLISLSQRKSIKTANIPSIEESGIATVACNIFLLSINEIGATKLTLMSESDTGLIGAPLDWFNITKGNTLYDRWYTEYTNNQTQIDPTCYYLRDPHVDYNNYGTIRLIDHSYASIISCDYASYTTNKLKLYNKLSFIIKSTPTGIRPAMILLSDSVVDENFNIL